MTKEDELVSMLNEKFVTKEDLDNAIKSKVPAENQQMAHEFLDHIKQCKSDDCEIHKYKQDLETENFIMGLLLAD